jgi:hypothetical protein
VCLVTPPRVLNTRRLNCIGSTTPMSCSRTRRLALDFSSVGRIGSRCASGHCVSRRDYSSSGLHRFYCAYAVHPDTQSRRFDFSSVGRTGSHRVSGHCVSRRDYSSSGLHRLYCAYVVHLDTPSRRSISHQSVAMALAVCPVIPLCVVTTRLVASTDILCLRRATGYLGTSRGSSSNIVPTPCVWVPRHLAWLVARLVIDYFAYAARPGASARRAARRVARRAAHRRLLRLRHTTGCLGTSRGSSSTTSRTPHV